MDGNNKQVLPNQRELCKFRSNLGVQEVELSSTSIALFHVQPIPLKFKKESLDLDRDATAFTCLSLRHDSGHTHSPRQNTGVEMSMTRCWKPFECPMRTFRTIASTHKIKKGAFLTSGLFLLNTARNIVVAQSILLRLKIQLVG